MTAPAPLGPNVINNHIAKRAPSRHDNTLRATLDQIAADPTLAPRHVFAETRPDNAASIWLLTKTGFYATGRLGPRPNRIEFALRQPTSYT